MHGTMLGEVEGSARRRRSTGHHRSPQRALAALLIGLGTALAGGAVTSASTPPVEDVGEPADPTGLGDDPAFDALAEACFAGDLESCDDLYWRTESGSDYEAYGSTCGGRLAEPVYGDCVERVGSASADPATPGAPAVMPPPTQEPTGLGTDADLNALAADCYAGAPFACDKLFVLGDEGTPYYTYGFTCAGRQAEDEEQFCHELVGFPGPGEGVADLPTPDDANVLALIAACTIGDMQACDDLYRQVEVSSPYDPFADTCAGRQPEDTGRLCVDAFPDWEQLLVVPDASADPGAGPSTTDPAVAGEPTDPSVLGEDPTFDGVAEACFDGDLESCDDLYWRSPLGSEYESYGATCGGRVTDRLNGACADSLTNTTPALELPAATIEPTGLGAEPAFDALAEDCYAGAMFACDRLYFEADGDIPDEQAYAEFADTCAGRQDVETGDYCHELAGFPEPTASIADLPTDDPKLFRDAGLCVIGDMAACDDIYRAVPEDSPYREFADTCAGRQETGTNQYCTNSFPDYELLYETEGATAPTGTDPSSPTATGATTTPSGELPDPTLEPTGLGTDAELNALAEECYDGSMAACDDLFSAGFEADLVSYKEYGDSCAGRQELHTGQLCEDVFGS